MKFMNKKISYCLLVSLLLTGCNDIFEEKHNSTNVESEKIAVIRHEFEYDENGTRVSLSKKDKGMRCVWKEGDEIGVLPIYPEINNPAKGKIHIADTYKDAHYAEFAGGGWQLDTESRYAAYYPFSLDCFDVFLGEPDINYELSEQKQSGNGNFSHVEDNIYMYAPSTNVLMTDDYGDKHSVAFDFQHLISILELHLHVPVATKWQYVSIVNKNNDPIFLLSPNISLLNGQLDLQEGSGFMSSFMTIELNDVETTSDNGELVIYMVVHPVETGELRVRALTDDYMVYEGSLTSKNLVAGKIYKYDADLTLASYSPSGTENGYEWVDLCLPSGTKWATTNIGAISPTDDGKRYSWGETKALGEVDETNLNNYITTGSYVKETAYWRTYKYGYIGESVYGADFQKTIVTKYNYTPKRGLDGFVDYKYILEPDDDAAYVNWGGKWKMPVEADIQELMACCFQTRIDNYKNSGITGITFFKPHTDKDRGRYDYYNRNDYSLDEPHVFFPVGKQWWSREVCLDYTVYCFNVSTEPVKFSKGDRERYNSYYVRPVLR